MALDFDSFSILLLLAPFLVAIIAPLISRETGPAAGWILAIVPAGLCLALSSLLPAIATGTPVKFRADWVSVLNLRLSFLIDGLSVTFGLLITGIGAIILVYSGAYLKGHPHRGRFLAFMLLFTGAMLGLVLSDSLVALFTFWELTAVTSFLLIGFDNDRVAARRGAIQALVVTGLGGLSLMAGGILLNAIAGTWDISALGASTTLHQAGYVYPWVLSFIVFAAFTKSAQIPFHFWLPNAMEAPTPVSAFLHSATMVLAGIYLLARMSPLLSGGAAWHIVLCCFGGATLLWGGLMALKQTDLKQLLAQTTIASLGLLVLLLGIGGELAALAVAAYFVAHALYKAALFLATGIIDKATGTRDITVLGGLRDHLTISFIASGLAAASMFGVPPVLGYLAKEEINAAIGISDPWAAVLLGVVVLGNALLGAAALALVVRPFMGALKPTPETPEEGSFALWIGPALFGLLGLAAAFAVSAYGEQIIAPMASAIVGGTLESHLTLLPDPLALPIWLSVITWLLAGLVYWQLDRLRAVLLALERRFTWSFDKGFDQLMFGLIRFAGGWTRIVHHGRLDLYLVIVFCALALALLLPLAAPGGWPLPPMVAPLTVYEWGALALAVIGIAAVVASRSRLRALVALGIQGLALALIFLFFGAPDLGFTQLLIEVLSVVVLALVMTRLNLRANDPRPLEDFLRDGFLSLVSGVLVTAVLLRVVQGTFDASLSTFFAANSAAVAHGRNIVNVILVDFRGLDTLGEISVVMTAGIAVLALLRRQHKREPLPDKPVRSLRRKAAAT